MTTKPIKNFEELVKGVRKAINRSFTMKRKKTIEPVFWPEEFDDYRANAHICWSPREQFKAYHDGDDYDKDRGRDEIDLLIGAAINLGIEQGLRIAAEQNKSQELITQLLMEEIKKMRAGVKDGQSY